MIHLVYANPIRLGGQMTFMGHLCAGLRALGEPYTVHCIGNNTSAKQRPLGYGMDYQLTNVQDLCRIAKHAPTLLTAISKPCAYDISMLMRAGAALVLHDPVQLKQGWDTTLCTRCLVFGVRPTIKKYVPGAVVLPHPYQRQSDYTFSDCRPQAAISLTRIDFNKHTDMLLDANRVLPKRLHIPIYGKENRIYTRFTIMPKYPEYVQGGREYHNSMDWVVNTLSHFTFSVNLSTLTGDGGGTQYTFLEAADAGAATVLNSAWLAIKGEMQAGENCLSVDNGRQLANLIVQWEKRDPVLLSRLHCVTTTARHMLGRHNAKRVAKLYLERINHAG